VKRKL